MQPELEERPVAQPTRKALLDVATEIFFCRWLQGCARGGYRAAGRGAAVQLLLGHTKLESTVRYLGIEVDDALEISEQTEI